MQYPNSIKPLSICKAHFVFLISGAFVVWLLFYSYEQEPIYHTPQTNTDSLKSVIRDLKNKKAEIKAQIVVKDSIRDRWQVKWRDVRHDNLMPCETILKACDTLIYQDSSLIASLKREIITGDSIILNQSKVILSDSISIAGLKKEVRRQKRQKFGIIALWIIREGLGIANKKTGI